MRFTLEGVRPDEEQKAVLVAEQNPDGGWPPSPTGSVSSLDTTCYRLAIAEASGIDLEHEAMLRAATFLNRRQEPDGSWEEDSGLSGCFPPWIRPGSIGTTLYLTANCGLWLELLRPRHPGAAKAGRYIGSHLSENGTLPTFLHGHWLAASLCYQVGRAAEAQAICNFLKTKLDTRLWASNLSWLLNCLRLGNISPTHALVQLAIERLVACQEKNGRWRSEDGAKFDVDTTLDVLTAVIWTLEER